MSLLLQLAVDMALAAVPSLGFALLFNVPRQALSYCALGGAVGHGLRFLLLHWGLPIEWGTLIAAGAISFGGIYWAKKLLAHPKVFSVAAVIPMIPGKHAFMAMLALFEINNQGLTPPLLATLTASVLKMAFITAALASGLAMPGLLIYRRKPIV